MKWNYKKCLLLLGFLLLMFVGCASEPENTENSIILLDELETSTGSKSPIESGDGEIIENTTPVVLGIVVSRKNISFVFNDIIANDVQSTQLYSEYQYNIIRDIIGIHWIVQKGGCGIDEPYEAWEHTSYMDISKLPVIQQSEHVLSFHGDDASDETLLEKTDAVEYTWIRLIYKPFYESYKEMPDGTPMSHKDRVVYIDPENTYNAILAEQNADKLNEWQLFTLPGYGSWLAKEIDILLRMSPVAS